MTHNLTEIQEALEAESTSLGITRYYKSLERGEADAQPGMKLLRDSMGTLTKAIEDYLTKASEGKAMRGANCVKFLAQFKPATAAYVTARCAINAMTKRVSLQRTAITLAGQLEDCLSHDELKAASPGLYRKLMQKIEKSSNAGYRHVVLKRQQKFAGLETIAWSVQDKFKLGQLLLHLMQESTGLIEVVQQGIKSPSMVCATEATLTWLNSAHSRCEILSPVYMPMVVPPLKWEGPFRGGYLTKGLRYSLIKTANKNYLNEMRSHPMPAVYSAINALQDTPWAINKGLYEVMRAVWDGGGSLGGLPPRNDLPLPAKTFTEDAPSEDPAVKTWKRQAAMIYDENVRLMSKRMSMSSKLWIAEKFAEFDNLYFPHAMDWRGRCYPVSSYVNPQSDDSGKALLCFANPCKLGDNGAYWLAVHGANCFGADKVPFAERVKWVQDNQEAIIDSGTNPLDGARLWAGADAPYQFLAFCLEWAALCSWDASGKPQGDFESALPVGLDGSCNGLQNFSAMLRDEVGGKATNLVPSETPSDIYAEVARKASELVAQAEGPMAAKWGGKITRKLVKRNTMTVPYSVSKYGMKDQVMEDLRKITAATGEQFSFEDAAFVADINYQAIDKVVLAARSAMTWLQEAAKVAAKDGLPVRWTTPSGMLVSQDYRTVVGERFSSYITGKKVRITLSVDSLEIDKRRMAAGIAPNFVHACDASHMVGTVNKCVAEGVWHFAMVHDSFGTHAGNVDVLAEQLRAAFVAQYTGDVLTEFRDELIEQLPEKLATSIPPVPPFGTLDVARINESEYFFA